MKKQKIQLIVLILILAALAGAFFGVRKYKEAQKPVEKEGIAVFDLDSGDVINMIYDYEGETYQYEKVDGTWYLAEDHSQTVKQYYLNAMAMGVSSVTADQVLENVTDLSQYGLETPQRTIIFDTTVQRFRIYVGDKNSLTSNYYIQLSDQPGTVYIVQATYFDRFNYGPEDVIEAQEEDTEGTDAGSGMDTEAGADIDAGTDADTDTVGNTGTE